MTRNNRQKATAQIHIARKQLGLDEDTYRQMIRTATAGRRESCADCTIGELHQVLQHLRDRGFKARPRQRVGQHPGTPHNLDKKAGLQKIEALLAELKAPWAYADAIARQQYGIERVAWLKTPEQFKAMIAALHVELEKRQLLAALEQLLAERNLTLAEIETTWELPKNWQRQRRVLKKLITQFEGRCA